MRLFVAADVSTETRGQVRAIREQLIPILEASRRAPRVTWVHEEGAHVTLRFIGEVTDERADRIQAALTSAVAQRPFEIRWDRLGTFPGGAAPRVIWLGGSNGGDRLAELAQHVEFRLTPVIGTGEVRPFKGHLTIGRVREPGRLVWADALARVDLEPTVTRIDHITLYRSQLSPKGPTYTEVLRTVLKQSARKS